MQSFIPQSPEAAAITNSVNLDMDKHGGLPSIGYPFESVQYKDITLSMGLNYQSGGIKVADVASSVGLGWSLNAGGSIVREIRGSMDEKYVGGFYQHNGINYVANIRALWLNGELEKVYYANNGRQDTQSDIYSYSFNGYSGKFFFDQSGAIFQYDKTNDLKIEVVNHGILSAYYNLEYIFTTPNGIKYYFGVNADGSECKDFERHSSVGSNPQVTQDLFPVTWHLTKIVSNATGAVVNFNYEDEHYYNYYESPGTKYNRAGQQIAPYLINGQFEVKYCQEVAQGNGYVMHIQHKRLSGISWQYGQVAFSYQNVRQDLTSNAQSSMLPKSLNTLAYQLGGQSMMSYILNLDYSSSGSTGVEAKRLMLRSVTKTAADATAEVTSFKYYLQGETDLPVSFSKSLPSRNSYSTDLFGFYNEASNARNKFFPKEDFGGSIVNAGLADRKIKPECVAAGSLAKVIFPTGGSISYIYESNEVYGEVRKSNIKHALDPYVCFVNDCSYSNEFLDKNLDVIVNDPDRFFNIYVKFNEPVTDVGADPKLIVHGYINSNTPFSKSFPIVVGSTEFTFAGLLSELGISTISMGDDFDFYFDFVDVYKLEFNQIQCDIYSEQNYTVQENRPFGGLRLKEQIINSNPGLIHKKYSYNDNAGKSTGKTVLYPSIFLSYPAEINNGNVDLVLWGLWVVLGPDIICTHPIAIATREYQANSTVPFINVNGNYLGYTEIKEVTEGVAGFVLYKYLAPGKITTLENPYVFPALPGYQPAGLNGKLNAVEYYSGTGELVESEVYTYNWGSIQKSFNQVVGEFPSLHTVLNRYSLCPESPNAFPYNKEDFFLKEYHLSESYCLLQSVTHKEDGITTTETYTYGGLPNLHKPTAIATSDGTSNLTQNFRYPFQTGPQALVDAHMIGIATEEYESGIMGGGSKVEFAVSPAGCTGCMLPVKYSSRNWKTGAWETEAEIKQYNTDALPLQIIKKGYDYGAAQYEQYTWSNGLLQYMSFLGRTTEFSWFPNRQLQEITAPDGVKVEFEYDGFLRLKKTKTKGGGAVSSYTYNYAAQSGENSVSTQRTFSDATYSLNDKVQFDGLGREIGTLVRGHLQSSTVFDPIGRIKEASKEGESFSEEYTYENSPRDRLEKSWIIGWPKDKFHSTTSEGKLLVKTTFDENGQKKLMYHDIFGRLMKEKRYMGSTEALTEYEYDGGGNVSLIKAPENTIYTFAYNGRNQLEGKSIPIKGSYAYSYNGRDLMETMTVPGAGSYAYSYNDFGEPDLVKIDGLDAIDYVVGSLGQETGKVIDKYVKLYGSSGGTVHYHYDYDLYGRVGAETVTHPWGSESYTYDLDNADILRQSIRSHTGTGGAMSVYDEIIPDAFGQPKTHNQRFSKFDPWYHVSTANLNSIDQVKLLKLGDNGSATPIREVSYDYNMRDWIIRINNAFGNCIEGETGPGPGPGDASPRQHTAVQVSYNEPDLIQQEPTTISIIYQMSWYNDTVLIASSSLTDQIYINGADSSATSNTDQFTVNLEGIVDAPATAQAIVEVIASRLPPGQEIPNLGITLGSEFVTPIKEQIEISIRTKIPKTPCVVADALFGEEINYIEEDATLVGAKKQYTGNINQMHWKIYGKPAASAYSFTYDDFDRMRISKFSGTVSGISNAFAEEISYADLLGNIQSITRKGVIGYNANNTPIIGSMDNLLFSYNPVNHQLTDVSEYGNTAYGFKGPGSTFPFGAGKLMSAPGRGIQSVDYNPVEMPEAVTTDLGKIDFIYDAEGTKWYQKTTIFNPVGFQLPVEEKVYIRGLEIVNGQLQSLYNAQGRALLANGKADRYEFSIRDHLGNSRVSFTDANHNGKIDESPALHEVLQTLSYYPFGLEIDGFGSIDISNPQQKFKYGGKEQLLSGIYDFGARMYDPVLGRWSAVDLMADHSQQVPW
ncbi:MAG: hypothetical protein ABIV51_07475, partial [Saprospiraceae bacterium]